MQTESAERRPQRPRSESKAPEIIELLGLIVDGMDEPVHYRMLTDAVQESGAFDLAAEYVRPSDSIYSMLHSDIRRNGDGSKFRFLGNGIFCAAGMTAGAKEVEVEPTARTRRTELIAPPDGADCQSCGNFSLVGVQLVTGTMGSCGCEAAARYYVKPHEPHCSHWCRRTWSQDEKARKEQVGAMELFRAVNIAMGRVARARAANV